MTTPRLVLAVGRRVGRPPLMLRGRPADRLHLIVLQRMKAKGVACQKERWFLGKKKVYIWSAEHCGYWRSDAAGYTCLADDAGVYDYEDARRRTWHCGPEKKIVFEMVR